jgi:hypothetical protein
MNSQSHVDPYQALGIQKGALKLSMKHHPEKKNIVIT